MYGGKGLHLENRKYVVSIFSLGRAQPLLLSSCYYLHLGVSVHSCPCSCLAGGPSISCLRVVSKVEGSGGRLQPWPPAPGRARLPDVAGKELDPGRNCLSSPSGLVFPSKPRLATIQWRPQFPMAQGSLQRKPPGQPCVPTKHVLRVVRFLAQGSLAH